jgi:hypothetical protein
VADLARAHLLLQRRPQLRRLEVRVGAAVRLVDVDVIGAQRAQRILELPDDLPRRPMVATQPHGVPARLSHALGVEAVTELRRYHPPLAIGRDRMADQ